VLLHTMAKSLCVFSVLTLFLLSSLSAVFANPTAPVTVPSGQVTLTLDDVFQSAITQSPSVSVTRIDEAIKEAEIRKIKADYWPKLNLSVNSQYSHNLNPITGGVTAVGSTVILPVSLYQNSVALSAEYTALDFGRRYQRKTIAGFERDRKSIELKEQERDTKVQVLETYAECYRRQKQVELQEQVILLTREKEGLLKRLYDSGVASKIEWTDAVLETHRAEEYLERLRRTFDEALVRLSRLTQDKYDPSVIKLDSLPTIAAAVPAQPTTGTTPSTDILMETLPEFQKYERSIRAKEAELKLVHVERWAPIVTLTSGLLFYGSSGSKPVESVRSMEAQTATLGMSLTYKIFDGFGSRADKDRVKLEIKRLRLEQKNAVNETMKDIETIKTIQTALDRQQKRLDNVTEDQQQKFQMTERLASQELIDQTRLMDEKIKTLNEHMNQVSLNVEQLLQQHKLAILRDYLIPSQ
jgi:outer membrane protein TolC